MSEQELYIACEQGDLAKVEQLLAGINLAAGDNFALRFAAENGHLAVVNRLLQEGERVDPAAGDNYALRWAASVGHLGVVKRLLRDNRVGLPPEAMHFAARCGHVEVLETLLHNSRTVAKEVNVESLEAAAAKGGAEVQEIVRRWRAEVER